MADAPIFIFPPAISPPLESARDALILGALESEYSLSSLHKVAFRAWDVKVTSIRGLM